MDIRDELTARSPLRILDRSMHGGLGTGGLGVVCAPAGVGKSAFLVDVALDELLRGREVLHFALEHATERVRSYYRQIFDEIVRAERIERPSEVWSDLERGLRIQAYQGASFGVATLERTLSLLDEHAGFLPDVVVVDGYDWARGSSREVDGIKRAIRGHGCELWMSASVEDTGDGGPFVAFPDPLPRYREVVDVLFSLCGAAGVVHVRLLKDREGVEPRALDLDLDPTTLLLVRA